MTVLLNVEHHRILSELIIVGDAQHQAKWLSIEVNQVSCCKKKKQD